MPKVINPLSGPADEPVFSISGGHPVSYGSGYAISGGYQTLYVVDDSEALRIIQERRARKAREEYREPPAEVPEEVAEVVAAPEPEPRRPPLASNPDFEDFVNTAKRAGF
jgi:hypothetical protein